MKTTLILKSAIVALFMLCAFNKAQAQFSSYPVSNNTGCTYKISYEFYDTSCNFISGGNTLVSPSGVTLVPFFPADDVKIAVLTVSSPPCSITQTPPAAGANNVCPTNSSSSLSTSCGCTVSSISVGLTGAVIN